jgi:hypothetical protein
MSLLSTDITKVKRISLKEVKLTAQEVRTEAPPQSTQEEPAFKDRLILKALAERLDLRLLRVRSLLDEGKRYTKRQAIDQIIERVGGGLINRKKAEGIFNKMLDKGTIEETGDRDYY